MKDVSVRDKRFIRELAWILVVKTIALFLIWLAFFSNPINVSSTGSQIQETIFSSTSSEATH
jgi:Na+/H+-dicarboxylate symporter